jgi:HlyD family secretion protein
MHQQLLAQTRITEDELKLSRVQFERSSALFKEGVISSSDYEAAKSSNWQKEYAMEGAKSSIANSTIQISQLEQSVTDMEMQYSNERKQLQLALAQTYETLTAQMAQWEQTYLLKAPLSGVVTFNTYWSVNQNVKAGDRVITIVPEQGGKIIGKLILPIPGSGKVKVGQIVNIKFDNYPFMEYGMVKGIIKSKSLVTADKFYSLEVDLPDGMVTSYKIKLEFSQEMQGIAEIITEDIRLVERILKPLKNLLSKM